MAVGELERKYRLHLPVAYDPAVPVPVVLAIHGYTGTAEKLENEYTSFSRHADARGYVVVYPQATGFEVDSRLVTSWNDLGCNASPGPEGPICTDEAFDYPTPPECGEPRECDWCSCHDDVDFANGVGHFPLEDDLCVSPVWCTAFQAQGGQLVSPVIALSAGDVRQLIT